MTTRSPIAYQSATPEYILAVIADEHRQQSQWDPEADPDAILTMQTSIAQWREACDLLPWRKLGHALNQSWGIGCNDEDWQCILEPAQYRTLGDLCHWIAARVQQPVIQPAGFMGASCMPAGAFLALRSMLQQEGVDMDDAWPSTPLHEYARRHAGAFIQISARLAPGSLPDVRVSQPLHDLTVCAYAIGSLMSIVGLTVGFLTSWHLLTITGVLIAMPAFLTLWASSDLPPRRVSFDNLQTFGDLARVLANGSSIRPDLYGIDLR